MNALDLAYWKLHGAEALGYGLLSFGIAILLIFILLNVWRLKELIFHFLDELELMARLLKTGKPIDPGRAMVALALSIFSAAKFIAAGLIIMAVVDAAS